METRRHTVNTPEYAAFRKLQVYEAALDEVLQGGDISQKSSVERSINGGQQN
jgi:hypothetical protein